MGRCEFIEAWVGQCNELADDSGFCEKHRGTKCCSCNEQATHTCDETGQIVCGAPLCDNCTHNTHPEGHNGGIGFNAMPFPAGMKTHCKKSEQKYAPWFIDSETLDEWKKENGIPPETEVFLTSNQL